MHLNISSLSYHHLELYNLLSNLKIKPNIIGISETRLQRGKQPITNISLPNYVYEHTPTESGKGGTLLYIDKNIKYKLRNDLNIYEKKMVESTFIEILNKKQKNMIIGCVYKHPKHEVSDFTNNYIIQLSYITAPTRITRNTKTIRNNIISGNLSSIISNHLIQFLIEPLDFLEKSSKMINRQRCYKMFDKLKFKADLF